MKKTIALLLAVLTVLLLAVPALALTGYELFTRWEQDGYPEDVTGVFYNTETQCLAILLTDNTEARQKAIVEFVNSKVSKFSKIRSVEIQKEPFVKTATHKIKRFLYEKDKKK